MDKKRMFVVVGVIWLAVILGFVGIKEYTLRTGREILLKTVPVDPRDLFRGDYVILSYEISTLDLEKVSSDAEDFRPGEKVYVVLGVDQEGYAVARGVYRVLPEDEALFVRATVKRVRHRQLTVEYGIESYFVPEGKGRKIESFREKRKLEVKAAVDRFGNAAIKYLLADGEKVRF